MCKINKWIGVLLLAMLSACNSDYVSVTAQFNTLKSIEPATVIFFDGEKVGSVTNVDNKETDVKEGVAKNSQLTIVEMSLDKKALEAIQNSAVVVVNTLKQGAPLEIYNPANATGVHVKTGDQLQGVNSLIELGAWMLNDAVQSSSSSLSSYVESFQSYLNSDEFQQNKGELQAGINNGGQEVLQALGSVSQEIGTALQDIQISEKTATEAVEKLTKELQPLAKDLGKAGSVLMQEVQKLSENLQSNEANDNQQLGEQALTAFLKGLGELKQSLESESQAKYQ